VQAEWQSLTENDFAALPRDLNYLSALAHLSMTAIALGDRARAEQLYARLLPYAQLNTPTLLSQVIGPVAHYLGELAHYLGRPAEAVPHFEAAVALNERMGYVTLAARSRVGLATALFAAGGGAAEEERARATLQAAKATAEELGLKPVLRSCEALARN
jgi:tetratricopeptide (TPR) repeat protein